MISRRQQPVQYHVQTVGAVQRKNNLFFRSCTEKLRGPKPATINGLLQLLTSVGRTSPNRSTILPIVGINSIINTIGLWKARRGIIEVDRVVVRVADKTTPWFEVAKRKQTALALQRLQVGDEIGELLRSQIVSNADRHHRFYLPLTQFNLILLQNR